MGEITIERVAVRLADDRLAFSIQVQGSTLGQPISAAASARGAPRYDRQAGAVHFAPDDFRLVKLAIGGKVVIDEGDASERGAEKTFGTLQRIVESAVKVYLATQPVYRFNNDVTGTMMQLALGGVAVEQSKLVISLSIWHLMLLAALFGLAVLVALYLVYLFVRRPPWRQTKAGP